MVARRDALVRFLTAGMIPPHAREVERQERAMDACGARIVSRADTDYPARLRPVPTAPEFLVVRGDLALADRPAAAVVGTRKPTAAGTALAVRLARDLAGFGITVVSGLARGIDTAAHRGALDVGGNTVAVLGTGVDVVYPPENGALMRRIADRGCVLSEQACGTPPRAGVFPQRNRIISGVCDVVVVVEGGANSGALITAQWALEQGREVGAVPGFPGDFRSAGPNRLLRDGAFLVEGAADVLASVASFAALAAGVARIAAGESAPAFDRDTERVWSLIAKGATADELARVAGMEIARVQEILARLEIDGHVRRDAVDRFTRAPL